MSEALTIGRMAAVLGVSAHTLRYYEQAGLLLPVSRTGAGHRLYARADVEWLRFVMRLKATGMPISRMQAFAALRARGDETAQERLQLLVEHREAVLERLAQLRENLAAIDDKVSHYEALAHDMTKHSDQRQRDKEQRWNTSASKQAMDATRGDGTS